LLSSWALEGEAAAAAADRAGAPQGNGEASDPPDNTTHRLLLSNRRRYNGFEKQRFTWKGEL